RQARGAGGLVFPGNAHRIEVGAYDACRRRGLFYLGDERDATGVRRAQCGREVASFRALEHGVTEIAGGDDARRQLSDLEPFLRNDRLENVHPFTLQSSSSLTPCMRFIGQPARSQPLTKASRSPSMTAWTLLVSTPVRRSFTMRYG